MYRNLPQGWDQEADVVAVGAGGGGLAAAIAAHDHGSSAIVLERSEQVGGVTAYSMGEVWIPGNHLAVQAGIEDSPHSGFRYVKALSMELGEDVAILNQAVHGPVALKYFEDHIGLKMRVIRGCPDYYYPLSNDALAEGRYLEVEPFPAKTLGEWQAKTRVSPHVPYAMTHDDLSRNGGTANMLNWDYSVMSARLENDERCLGPGLAAYFVKGALDRSIPLLTGFDVQELIGDGSRVVGVRASQNGKDVFIRANRGVVLAVSSFERNAQYAKTLGGHVNLESMVMPTVDGAHLRMAGAAGARIAQVPDVTGLAIHMPGEETEDGVPLWRGSIPFLGLPHTIVVNRAGKRFADESFYRSVYFATDVIDGATQSYPNFPCWIVLDSQARSKYPLGSVMPGEPLPEGVAVSADTVEDLAARIGVNARQLRSTIQTFNGYCEKGVDPDFNRGQYPWSATMTGDPNQQPHPNFGPLTKPPFYAVELRRLGGGGITSTGIVGDEHCRVMGWDGEPIEGLYVAGNSMARMDNGALMQSGMTNARGMTHGYLAGRHAAGQPSDLLQRDRLGW
jgi:3-oxosteroid 1-dehydrogenase